MRRLSHYVASHWPRTPRRLTPNVGALADPRPRRPLAESLTLASDDPGGYGWAGGKHDTDQGWPSRYVPQVVAARPFHWPTCSRKCFAGVCPTDRQVRVTPPRRGPNPMAASLSYPSPGGCRPFGRATPAAERVGRCDAAYEWVAKRRSNETRRLPESAVKWPVGATVSQRFVVWSAKGQSGRPSGAAVSAVHYVRSAPLVRLGVAED
jgi:hypothetical protein